MARPKIQEDDLLDRLTAVFQAHGYEGASLSRLSRATGLERASLYHRFPGGKEEMAQVILDRAAGWLVQHVLAPLGEPGRPEERVARMAERLGEFYHQGRRSCLLDTLSLGGEDSPFQNRVREAMATWVEAMASISSEAGFPREEALRRAEDALVQIQGGLVVARGTGNREAFLRVLRELPRSLASRED